MSVLRGLRPEASVRTQLGDCNGTQLKPVYETENLRAPDGGWLFTEVRSLPAQDLTRREPLQQVIPRGFSRRSLRQDRRYLFEQVASLPKLSPGFSAADCGIGNTAQKVLQRCERYRDSIVRRLRGLVGN